MDIREKKLYHQIHPLKLATDIGVTPFGLYTSAAEPVPETTTRGRDSPPRSSRPLITELSPSSVRAGSVPFTMTVNGVNFGTDSVVFWNGIPHSMVVTSKQLLVTLTDTDLTHFGLVPVFVRTGGLNSNTVDFDVSAQ